MKQHSLGQSPFPKPSTSPHEMYDMHRLPTCYRFSLLLAASIALACGQGNIPATPPGSALEALFQYVGTTVVEGTKESPVFFPGGMTIREGSFYVTDELGHTLTIFDLANGSLRQLGREGAGPGDLKEPGDVGVDGAGNVYVNDAGNRRIQVFSPTGESIDQVPLPQRALRVFLLPENTPNGFLLVGLRVCGSHTNCRATQIDMDGRILRQFAPQIGPLRIVAFAAALSTDGELFIANYLDTAIQLFGTDGSEVSQFDLASPALIPFDDGQPEDAPFDRNIFAQHYREGTYTPIEAIHTSDSLVLVQLRIANPPDDQPEYMLDVYSRDGHPRYLALETPGRLVVDNDDYYFVTHDEASDYGRFTVIRYSMLPLLSQAP